MDRPLQLPAKAIPLPAEPVTDLQRWAVRTLLTQDDKARVIRIELDIHYFLAKNGVLHYNKTTHHSLEAVDSFVVDPATLEAATPTTKNPTGEYSAYVALIESGAIPIPMFVSRAIVLADARGRFLVPTLSPS